MINILYLALALIYFYPTIIGVINLFKSMKAAKDLLKAILVGVINFYTGWTIIGWIIAKRIADSIPSPTNGRNRIYKNNPNHFRQITFNNQPIQNVLFPIDKENLGFINKIRLFSRRKNLINVNNFLFTYYQFPELAFIHVVNKYQEAKRGDKAIANIIDRNSPYYETWDFWFSYYRVNNNRYMLVDASQGWGPHNLNKVMYVSNPDYPPNNCVYGDVGVMPIYEIKKLYEKILKSKTSSEENKTNARSNLELINNIFRL